ncbi:MAG TPA: hypothetical protein VGL81_08725 [Polyangiaceae bacterium]
MQSRCVPRDRDDDADRERHVESGIARAGEIFGDLRVVGGVARENIEGWILLLSGHDGESVPSKRTKAELEQRCGITTLQQKVDAIASAPLDKVGPGSLGVWLERASAALVPG